LTETHGDEKLGLLHQEDEQNPDSEQSKLAREMKLIRRSLKAFQIQLVCRYTDQEGALAAGAGGNYRGTTADDWTVPYRRIREVSTELEQLVLVSGIVVQSKPKRHKATSVLIRCKSCTTELRINVHAGFGGAALPKKCPNDEKQNGPNPQAGLQDNALGNAGNNTTTNDGSAKCGQAPWVIVGEDSEYQDYQEIKLQELSADVPLGDMPRSITCLVSRGLCDRLSPGNKITFLAVPVSQNAKAPGRGGDQHKEQSVKFRYLSVVGFCEGGVVNGTGPRITPDEEQEFQQWAKGGRVHDLIKQSIAPAICGSSKDPVIDMVKRGIACLLFGGSRKTLPDGTTLRGDINLLLLGDPSTAKSQFLKFTHATAPTCIYTSGKGSSAAGLTAAVTKDNSTGNFTLEGGAMVLADGGVVCIDEFDKMKTDDRVAIHEAMEQQTISIAKAGITVVLNTRCAVLAAANPIYGSYDESQSTAEQIDFATSILSRFDLIFLIRDMIDGQRDLEIARHVIKLRQGAGDVGSGNFVDPPIKGEDLKKFLAYAKRKCEPRLSREAAALLQSYYVSIRQQNLKDRQEQAAGGAGSGTLPITVRQLEAIARLSEAMARMELQDSVRKDHVREALKLFSAATLEANGAGAGRRGDAAGGGFSNDYEREQIQKADQLIKNRVAIGAKIKRDNLLRYLQEQEIEAGTGRKAVHILVQKGLLEETAGNSYKRLS